MAAETTLRFYDLTQRALHWLMAAIILVAIVPGVIAALLPEEASARHELLLVHKSLGMTALALVIVRAVYRAFVGAPPYGDSIGPLTRAAARAEQYALYALMVAMPVSGYLTSTAGGHEVSWFGLFSWPALVAPDKTLARVADQTHYWLAWTIGALLALHVAAAAWHYWIERDDVFARMWPSKAARPSGRG